jgi:tetratricopeptide (TPR) repeat protein
MKALAASQAAGARYEEGKTRSNLAIVLEQSGHFAEALEQQECARAIFHEVGSRRAEAMCLNNLGQTYREMGDFAKSLALHFEGLEVARRIGYRLGEAYHVQGVGRTYFSLQDYAQALENCRQAITLYSELGHEHGLLDVKSVLGWALLCLNRPVEARQVLEDAAQVSSPRVCYQALPGLGLACLHTGDRKNARDAFARAVEGCEGMLAAAPDRYVILLPLAFCSVGLALLEGRRLDRAEGLYRQARNDCTVGDLLDEQFLLGQLETATGADLSSLLAVLDSQDAGPGDYQ